MAHSRGKVYCDERVQGALARRIVYHWCTFFLLCLSSLLALEYFLGDPQLTMRGHLAAIWNQYAFFVLLMIAVVPSFVYDALKLSNRFAGPMIRLKESIRTIADGEPATELKFRDGDFWDEVSQEFNRMAHQINDQRSETQGA